MEENIAGVISSWLVKNQNDVFSSISTVEEIINDRKANVQNSDIEATTMIEIFLDRSDPNLPEDSFPPKDFDSFMQFLCDVEDSIYRKFAIIYFLIDEFDNTENKSIEDVFEFANLILVSREQVQFVLGCINLDASISTPNIVTQLTFKALPKSLEFPILSSLLARKMYQDAFIFYTCKKPKPQLGSIDQHVIIIYTLILNSRLYEALKYIRSLDNLDHKNELLEKMFEISNEKEKEKEFSNLAFTYEEEEQVLSFDFPSENHFKRFCLARRRFDKYPEGENFKCSF